MNDAMDTATLIQRLRLMAADSIGPDAADELERWQEGYASLLKENAALKGGGADPYDHRSDTCACCLRAALDAAHAEVRRLRAGRLERAAVAAMQGLCAHYGNKSPGMCGLASEAMDQAHALLAELDKEQG